MVYAELDNSRIPGKMRHSKATLRTSQHYDDEESESRGVQQGFHQSRSLEPECHCCTCSFKEAKQKKKAALLRALDDLNQTFDSTVTL